MRVSSHSKVILLLILTYIIICILGFLFIDYRDAIFLPLLAFFLPAVILSLILVFFPKKVFQIWFPLLVIVSPFFLKGVFESSVDGGGCWAVCYPRTSIAGMISFYVFINIAWISIVIGLIWHFVSRRKENKQKDTQEKVEKQA